MSAINSVGNSLTSSLLSSLLSGSSSSSGTASTSANINSDIVSLLGGSSTSSTGSLYSTLLGGSGSSSTADPMYGVLLSAESASLLNSNPALAQDIVSAYGTSTTGGSSSSSTSTESLVNELQALNLVTVSPDTLLSLVNNSSSGSGSTISTTA